ncbi:MAG TPA: hypothetical protein VM163_06285 [bacterium]|nr:hypothetical protein [bacterium]
MKTLFSGLMKSKTSRPLLWLAIIFVFIQVIFHLLGMRFSDALPYGASQFLDTELLRHRLLESVFYMHSQPPLFNLFLGLALKLSSGYPRLAFHAIYAICGLILYCSLFTLQVRLGVGKWLAFVLSTMFIVSPTNLMHQNDFNYPLILALLLLISALLLDRFLVEKNVRTAVAFFFCLFLLSGIRSLYHLSYFVLILVVLLALNWADRRKLLLAAALPGLLIVALHVKNLILFNVFATSSWLGMNAWAVVADYVPPSEREQLVREGTLSELALITRFSPVNCYPEKYRKTTDYRHIPVLTQTEKSSGAANYNHLAYVGISKQYFKDYLTLSRQRPRALLKGLTRSCLHYLSPCGIMFPMEAEYNRMRDYTNAFQVVFYARIPADMSRTGIRPFGVVPQYRVHLFLFLGLPILFIGGLALSLRKSSARFPIDRRQRIVILFLCLNIAYVAFVGNAFESGEQARFRFQTDPFYVVLLGLLIQSLLIPRLTRVLHRMRPDSPTQVPSL